MGKKKKMKKKINQIMKKFAAMDNDLLFEDTMQPDCIVMEVEMSLPLVEHTYFYGPTTVVEFSDATSTSVTCLDEDMYSADGGVALCIAKRYMDKSEFDRVFKNI